jgi:2-succinyl-5-enolpyruvyl-6-hydroxy-3-cyclohexene-1-carboxylate synthase
LSAADNSALATATLRALHAAGVRTLCVCPGGRNAPLVLAADAAGGAFDLVTFPDERVAAFFALGRIRRDGAPAAVVTTSGTAAAELLPAMLEACHSGLPLIAVTADRPRRLRGTGAPQTIDQIPLFAAAGAPVFDVDAAAGFPVLPRRDGPVHLNVCFDEPLVGGPAEFPVFPPHPLGPAGEPWMDEAEVRRACAEFFGRTKCPLVLVSSLDPAEAAALVPWLASLPCPLHLEAVSQLREHPALQGRALHSGERILLAPECRQACDGILRIGGIPTPRFWRELEDDARPVLHVSRLAFPGLARRAPVVPLDVFAAIASEFVPSGGGCDDLLARDRVVADRLSALLDAEPRSEAALVRDLAAGFAADARVFLGNSLPIREWDLAAPRTASERTIFANRGVNGIDGLVSTALGLADAGRPLAAVLGDLSALYDLGGLWPVPALAGADITLAVVNNGGGQIFRRMFRHRAFLNEHSIEFGGWAGMFGWHHAVVTEPGTASLPASPRLIEVRPDPAATERFAAAHAALWA